MHLQMNYNYTRIRPKIGYSMSEKYIYQPQNMIYFSKKMHVSMAPGFFKDPSIRWYAPRKDGVMDGDLGTNFNKLILLILLYGTCK